MSFLYEDLFTKTFKTGRFRDSAKTLIFCRNQQASNAPNCRLERVFLDCESLEFACYARSSRFQPEYEYRKPWNKGAKTDFTVQARSCRSGLPVKCGRTEPRTITGQPALSLLSENSNMQSDFRNSDIINNYGSTTASDNSQ